jgi:hypothetical protein
VLSFDLKVTAGARLLSQSLDPPHRRGPWAAFFADEFDCDFPSADNHRKYISLLFSLIQQQRNAIFWVNICRTLSGNIVVSFLGSLWNLNRFRAAMGGDG